MDDTAKKDIRDLKKGQDTIMEILDSIVERQDHFEESVDNRFDRQTTNLKR